MDGSAPVRDHPPRDGCVFCRIAAGDEPARYLAPGGAETADRSTLPPDGPLAFRNRLTWLRVMALVIPPGHPSQEQLWTDRALYLPLLEHALALGRELTIDTVPPGVTPEGFRLVSNFGRIAHQSQHHAHVHVMSRPDYEPMPEVKPHSPPVTANPIQGLPGDVVVDRSHVVSAPWSARVTLAGVGAQEDMWSDARLPGLVGLTVKLAEDQSPEGYRLAADFLPEPGMGPAGLFILGGGQLDLYA